MKHFLLSYLNSQVLVHWAGNWTNRVYSSPLWYPSSWATRTQQAMNMTAVSYIIKFVICIICIFILLFQD